MMKITFDFDDKAFGPVFIEDGLDNVPVSELHDAELIELFKSNNDALSFMKLLAIKTDNGRKIIVK